MIIKPLLEIGREAYITLAGRRHAFEQVNVERRSPFSAKASKGILLRAVSKLKSCEAPWREADGAGEGIRTLDPDLGKVVLYP